MRAAERIDDVEEEGDIAIGEFKMEDAGLNTFERDRSKGLSGAGESSQRPSILGAEFRRRLRRALSIDEGTP